MSDMEDIFEIIDGETYLSGNELLDAGAVKEDLYDIAIISDEVDEWIKSVGIDVAVGMLIQRNSNSYLGIEKLITELIRIMEFNDSSVADMGKCITDIYEQYEVPIKDRKSLSEFMNR